MTLLVAGIDLAAGRGTTELALLTQERDDARPRFDAGGHRSVSSDEDIVAVIAGVRPSVIAIDAPLSLPAPVAAALRSLTQAETAPSSAATPYTRAAERSPIWVELGIRPLPVSFLGGLTFRAIALVPKLHAAAPEAAIIEVFPTATLRRLGVTARESQTPHHKRLSKTSEAARMAVQGGLARWIAGLPDPQPALLSADLLDALAAALTAIAFAHRDYIAIGDADEGQIILPCKGPTEPSPASTGSNSLLS